MNEVPFELLPKTGKPAVGDDDALFLPLLPAGVSPPSLPPLHCTWLGSRVNRRDTKTKPALRLYLFHHRQIVKRNSAEETLKRRYYRDNLHNLSSLPNHPPGVARSETFDFEDGQDFLLPWEHAHINVEYVLKKIKWLPTCRFFKTFEGGKVSHLSYFFKQNAVRH